jgi:hypothetical protein
MESAKAAAENFHRTVGTVEASVSFNIRSIADEDGNNRMCHIELPNQEGAHGRFCIAYLAPKHVESLIETLAAWKALP